MANKISYNTLDPARLPMNLTLREAAAIMRASVETLRQKAASGEIDAFRLGEKGKWLIPKKEALRLAHIECE